MNLIDLDWKSLVILDALVSDGNVSRVAQNLRLSQPTVSHTLAKLREALKDPLFIRTRAGMVPTDRAKKLQPVIREMMALVGQVIEPQAKFSPQEDGHDFRILTTDYLEAILLPKLCTKLLKEAPKVRVAVQALREKVPSQDLESGGVDLAIGAFPSVPGHLYEIKLFTEDFVALVPEKKFPQEKFASVKQFASYQHVLVSPWGGMVGIMDEALKKHGLSRNVIVSTPHFLAAPFIGLETGAVVTLPRRLAMLLSESLPFRMMELPLKLPSFTFKQIWHARTHESASHRWLRQLIQSVVA